MSQNVIVSLLAGDGEWKGKYGLVIMVGVV